MAGTVGQMLSMWMTGSFYSFNISDIATKAAPLCPEYKAPSNEFESISLAWLLPKLALWVSYLFFPWLAPQAVRTRPSTIIWSLSAFLYFGQNRLYIQPKNILMDPEVTTRCTSLHTYIGRCCVPLASIGPASTWHMFTGILPVSPRSCYGGVFRRVLAWYQLCELPMLWICDRFILLEPGADNLR